MGGRVKVAASWTQRLVGLLGTSTLSDGEGLWITPCQAVHTFFMRYPIDVVFLDDRRAVLHQQTLGPWRFSAWKKGSRGILELPAGTLSRTGTMPGDEMEMQAL
jgi:uncharacterized protein